MLSDFLQRIPAVIKPGEASERQPELSALTMIMK